jgi:hypothetical protein
MNMKSLFCGALAVMAVCASIAAVFTLAPESVAVAGNIGLSDFARATATDLAGLMIGVGMTTLARDTYRDYELGEENQVPAVASDIIYEGSAVGDNASGYGRPLVAADQFLGFCIEKCDNSAGSAGDKNIRVKTKGRISLTVSGVAITDVGKAVYASDDNAFTLTESTNSYIGRIVRYVGTDTCIVEFDVSRGGLANQTHVASAVVSTGSDSGTFNGTFSPTVTGTQAPFIRS